MVKHLIYRHNAHEPVPCPGRGPTQRSSYSVEHAKAPLVRWGTTCGKRSSAMTETLALVLTSIVKCFPRTASSSRNGGILSVGERENRMPLVHNVSIFFYEIETCALLTSSVFGSPLLSFIGVSLRRFPFIQLLRGDKSRRGSSGLSLLGETYLRGALTCSRSCSRCGCADAANPDGWSYICSILPP